MDVTTAIAHGAGRVLDGFVVARRGDSAAIDVAMRHLQALGSVPADTSSRGGSSLPSGAGYLAIDVPHGRAGRRALAECSIDWPGPADVALEDEATVQAGCGIMHVHGRQSGAPMPLAVDYASTLSGVLAAQGVVAALVARDRGMERCHVATSVGQAALLAVSQYLAAATAGDDSTEPEGPWQGPPFKSADGVRFEIEALEEQAWRHFWALVGADAGAIRRGWRPFLHRYATATCPLPGELHRAAGRRQFAALTDAAAEAFIGIQPLRDPAEASAALAPENTAGRSPWQIVEVAGDAPIGALPQPPTTAQLPLEGVVVAESTRRIQGPLAGHLLRLLGARVVRIEPPGGEPMRGVPPIAGDCSARFLALNRGKEVVEIDIKSAAGRSAVKDVVAEADVFLHNWAPGKASELELDARHLATVRRGLVYSWASGWGAARGSAPPPGTDFMVQAYSGLAAAVRPPGEPPATSLMTLTDLLGGAICAQGVLAGLLARVRTGKAQRVHSSLLSAATTLQHALPAAAENAAWSQGGRRPWTKLHRPLPTSDGYLALSERARTQPDRVAAAMGLGCCDGSPELDAIVARCREEPAAEWIARLRAAGLTAVQVCTDLSELAGDHRFCRALEHRGCTFPRSPWEFSS